MQIQSTADSRVRLAGSDLTCWLINFTFIDSVFSGGLNPLMSGIKIEQLYLKLNFNNDTLSSWFFGAIQDHIFNKVSATIYVSL